MEPLIVDGKLDALGPIRQYVMAAAAKAGLNKRRSYDLALAVDEVATNIVTHGYAEAGLSGQITVRGDIDQHALVLTLEDTAVPYDPTKRPPPQEEDFDRPLEERDIGGWGVYLAIQSVDNFIYRYVDGMNRNVFVMNRDPHGDLLIVADLHETRDSLSRLLRAEGYEVETVETASEALEKLAARPFDLVCVDVGILDSASPNLMQTMKADNALRGIPILVLTDLQGIPAAEQSITAGADDYLRHPFSPVVVRARIGANLEKQRVKIAEAALKESEKYERDVLIGHQIQLSFLPETLPQPRNYEIAGRFAPARQVAGDFYDSFLLPNQTKVALVLGDVCDKGVGAALFMALFRSMLRAFAQQNYPMSMVMDVSAEERRILLRGGNIALKMAVELTNNYIVNNHASTNMFATVFFGILDPATGDLYYVNAGHEAPIIFQDGVVKARLGVNGPAVGIIPQITYPVQLAHLDPGDTLLIYTDGVTEAKDPGNHLYGEQRLLKLIEKPAPSAAALLEDIELALREHIATAAQFDDITMLAVRRETSG
ncbi:MAG: SpoIIE family protein phosphatase [Anaerolineae bacterium]